MNCNLKLTIDQGEDLFKVLSPEINQRQYGRSTTELDMQDKTLNININAKDFTAMRATSTGILKLIAVYDKLQ